MISNEINKAIVETTFLIKANYNQFHIMNDSCQMEDHFVDDFYNEGANFF